MKDSLFRAIVALSTLALTHCKPADGGGSVKEGSTAATRGTSSSAGADDGSLYLYRLDAVNVPRLKDQVSSASRLIFAALDAMGSAGRAKCVVANTRGLSDDPRSDRITSVGAEILLSQPLTFEEWQRIEDACHGDSAPPCLISVSPPRVFPIRNVGLKPYTNSGSGAANYPLAKGGLPPRMNCDVESPDEMRDLGGQAMAYFRKVGIPSLDGMKSFAFVDEAGHEIIALPYLSPSLRKVYGQAAQSSSGQMDSAADQERQPTKAATPPVQRSRDY